MDSDDVWEWLSGKYTENELKAICVLACRELHDNGYSLRDIGEALGVSHMWVQRALASQTLLQSE